MSNPEDLNRVVQRLLRENNVELKELIKPVVPKIAREFREAGLIPREVEDQMLVTGVDPFTLATRLVNACQTSLAMFQDKNFPKFIEILKRYDTMKPLAAKMEPNFQQARESYIQRT